jgi:hypothetical protein
MRGPALYHTFSHLSIGKIAQKREVNNTSLLVNIPDCWLNLFLSVDGLLKKCFGKKLACIFILVTVKLGKLLQTPLLSSF